MVGVAKICKTRKSWLPGAADALPQRAVISFLAMRILFLCFAAATVAACHGSTSISVLPQNYDPNRPVAYSYRLSDGFIRESRSVELSEADTYEAVFETRLFDAGTWRRTDALSADQATALNTWLPELLLRGPRGEGEAEYSDCASYALQIKQAGSVLREHAAQCAGAAATRRQQVNQALDLFYSLTELARTAGTREP